MKMACFEDWEHYKDVLFFQPIMIKNLRTKIELEVISESKTERAIFISKDLKT